MILDSVRTRIVTALSEAMAGHGFLVDGATSSAFRRSRDGIRNSYNLVFHGRSNGTVGISPSIGVRFDLVEEIFHRSSNYSARDQKGTWTMASSLAQLQGRVGDLFVIAKDVDAKAAVSGLLDGFRTYAIPYYEQFKSIDTIDSVLNDDPSIISAHRSTPLLRCATAIIVARLAGRRDFGELVERYREMLARVSRGFYLRDFESLVTTLADVEPITKE